MTKQVVKKKSLIIFKTFLLVSIFLFGSFTFFEEENNPSSAFELINNWSLSRNYPFNSVPSQALLKAKEFSKNNLNKKLLKTNEPDPWKAIGPNNIGGRTLCIAINPKNPETIYAGSAGGGLWRSYTGGKGADAWDYISTGFPVLAVSAIAIDPLDTNRIYIGTGEVYNLEQTGTDYADKLTIGSYGIGIIKTANGGTSWEQSLIWSDSLQVGVNAIKIDPFNKKVIWAATTEGTYKSINYGEKESWSRVHEVKMATDLIISPTNQNKIFVACGNLNSAGNGLYKTENGGISWSNTNIFPKVISSLLLGKGRIDVCESESNFIVTTLGYGDYYKNTNTQTLSYKTENGGLFWLPAPPTFTNWASINGWYSHDIAINPSDSKEIFAGGLYLWKSTDGGSKFTQVSTSNIKQGDVGPGENEGLDNKYVHQNIHEIVYHPTNQSIIYFATDGGVFRTTDGGQTFEGCNGGYQTANFNQGFSQSQQDKNFIIAGAHGNGTNIYTGSNAWKKYVLPFDGGITGINSLNDNEVYASYQNLNVFKSNNKGNAFGQLSIPGLGRITSYIAPFVVGDKNPEVIYAGRDLIYKSIDGGNTWAVSNKGGVLDGNPIVKMAISPQSDDVVYAATFPLEQKEAGVEAGLFRTADGGDSWENITQGLPDRFVGNIYVHPAKESRVFVTLLGFGSSHLYRSENIGQDWTDIGTGLPDVPTSAIVVDPENETHIYVGSDLGVYFSPDNGTTWQEFSTGLPDAVMITDLKIFKNERLLRASTNGAGFFERKLATENPVKINEEIIPQDFELYQNYPNPFNPTTVIKFVIPNVGTQHAASLQIYDVLGREIEVKNFGFLNEGIHEIEFNGSNLSSGVYYYRLEVGKYSQTKKMLLIK
ncbi:MAG: hypothetical protein A2068_06125 [Ignavibacteria bacterium GWB2_35_6b]|nr:MAG: hypothetical protein A2068_06125 [Ignavibacteria bacterium GWB2_35_6b]